MRAGVVLPCLLLWACESANVAEQITGECDHSVAVERDGVVSHSGCNGCDPDCWITTDDPNGAAEVIPSGAGQNGTLVSYDSVLDGVVLDGAVSGVDTDGDGIIDLTDPDPADANGDADGDGYPDSWEIVNGTDPFAANPAPAADELYAVLPYEGPAVTVEIPPSFPIAIRAADVYFLIDTTSSMSDEIANLQDSISDFIIPSVLGIIPDTQFGLGQFRDVQSTGGVFAHFVDITADAASVQTAVDSLTNSAGWPEWAEGQVPALHAVATGSALSCGPGARVCTGGRLGYPCFRPDAQPIIVIITDAEFHNGVWDTLDPSAPNACYEYSGCSGTCFPLAVPYPSLETVVGELNTLGAKIIGAWSGWPNNLGRVNTWTWGRTYPNFDAALDIYYLVAQTGSVDASNVPFLYGINTNGTGMDTQIVDAIDDLVSTMLIDVSSTWSDPDPSGPNSAVLVEDVDPVACDPVPTPPRCTINHTTNIAYDVPPGTGIPFSVVVQNDTGDVPSTPATQTFDILIQIMGNGASVLAELTVHVLVPGTVGLVLPPTTGEYWHVFEEEDTCLAAETVHWNDLVVDMDTPAGTWIDFTAQTSDDDDPIDWSDPTIDVVPLTVDTGGYIHVGAALEAASIPVTNRALRILATLNASAPGDTPVLHDISSVHYCR